MTQPLISFFVRIEGTVPRVDQIAVQAATAEEAMKKAVEIALEEGFVEAKAINAVPVSSPMVVPRR